MDAMEMLCDPMRWERAINKAVDKKKDKGFLSLISRPESRAMIIEAINDGRYEIQPPRTSYINKKTGKYITYEQSLKTEKVRELFACTELMDNLLLTILCGIKMDMFGYMIHPNCRSYQRGIGVRNIIHDDVLPRLKSGMTGYKMDLSKYFDTPDPDWLDGLLRATKTGTPIDDVEWNMYHDNRVYIGRNTYTSERYMGFRQGNALATFYANIGLYDIDAMADNYDVLYVRYSDDILVLGKDADIVKANVEKMLVPKGLTLNPKKVEAISSDKTFTFLGCEITGQKVDISDESVERLKKEVKKITKPRKTTQKYSRTEQKRAIKKVNWILRDAFSKSTKNFGWEEYFFGIVNTNEKIIMLDEYIKDHLKAVYVQDWNHTKGMHHTSNEQLEEMGYKSLNQLYKAYKMSRDIYHAEIQRV